MKEKKKTYANQIPENEVIPEYIPVTVSPIIENPVTVIPEFIPVTVENPVDLTLLDIDPLALLQNARNRTNLILNHFQNRLSNIDNAINAHTTYKRVKQSLIDTERVNQLIAMNAKMGAIVTNVQAMTLLGIIQSSSTTTTRTSDNGSMDIQSTATGNDEMNIHSFVKKYHCSFGKLPASIKAWFVTEGQRTMYSQLQGYFNSLISNGSVGDSYYSNLIKHGNFDRNTMTCHKELPQFVLNTEQIKVTYQKTNKDGTVELVPYERPLSPSTSGRFFEAVKLTV